MSAIPVSLPENTGLAHLGESEWAPAIISASQAETFSATRNPAGRPNSDVLRCYVGTTGRQTRKHWQIDFPTHYDDQEAALHEKPFALLEKRAVGRTKSGNASTVGASLLATQEARSREQARSYKSDHDPAAQSGNWWINPHAKPPLRHALARLDRFLATALDASKPAWIWFESEHLPDASLIVIARDDDFTHAVLQSAAFTTWWHAHRSSLAPVQLIESFPFPWPPATPLGSLTKAQQELRSSAARASLGGDIEQVNSTIAAAYGWPSNSDPCEILPALNELHRQHCSRGR